MKIFFTFLLAVTFSASSLVAQTIVGTDPENKNVVLEEFTGIHCSWCPTGHALAQGIQDAHPDDVALINIHEGGFAVPSAGEPDYRTPMGNVIASQAGSSSIGWPSGSVNRHIFSGSVTAMSRGIWVSASNQILDSPSYLNVGLIATVITSTRQLTVEVEIYYTGDSPESTNYLNVAILQDSILGPQTNGGAGNNYNHMHMLRHLLTGQWGVEISETTTGSFYSETFTYELPENYTEVDVILENLDIVAFVTETRQEIISGKSVGDITYIESNDYDAAIISVSIPQTLCSDEITPVVNLKNYGVIDLTSLEFFYTVNGGDNITFSWSGNLAQNESVEVTLPTLNYTPTDNNTIDIWCESPNGEIDQLPQNDSYDQISEGSQNYPENCSFMVLIMENPEAITWNITDETGTIIEEGGPYTNIGFKVHPFTFPEIGCYKLNLYDATGQGLSGYSYVITNDNNDVLWTGGEFGYETTVELAHGITVDIDEIITADDISIHPNPVTNNANIEFSLFKNSNVNIAVFDILGKNVMSIYNGEMSSGSQNIKMNANELNNGVYFVRIQMNNEIITKKVLVNR